MKLDEVMEQAQCEVMSVVTRHVHRLSPSGAREVVEFIRDELATYLEGLEDGPRTATSRPVRIGEAVTSATSRSRARRPGASDAE